MLLVCYVLAVTMEFVDVQGTPEMGFSETLCSKLVVDHETVETDGLPALTGLWKKNHLFYFICFVHI